MRYSMFAVLLVIPAWLPAQTADADRGTLQALLNEVQQLRIAIERSTLLGARTQIAINLMQAQEGRVDRITQELEKTRKEILEAQAEKPKLASRVKMIEEFLTTVTDAASRKQMEHDMNMSKLEGEQLSAREQDRSARESELSSQLRAEQSRLVELQGRIADMERMLDNAIQQTIPRK